MRPTRPLIYRLLFVVLCCLLARVDAVAQEQTYTLALRGVTLDDAIERFVDATGIAVSYAPDLVRGHTSSCAAENAKAEAVLACILRESGLDYYRLSSGTYVLTESAEAPPERGYLAGRVVDAETGQALQGAHVLLADAGVGTVTDRSGRFTLPALLPGPYTISVSHLGYRSWSDSLVVAPRESVHTEASMRPEPVFITPVVIDGLQERPPSSRLGRPQVGEPDASGRPASMEAVYHKLPTIPGVRLNDVTADVHVQGGDAGAHQLRLDGAPVFLPWSVDGLVGPFAGLAVDRITVHKAGFGATHGSSLGGMVEADHALAPENDLDVQADPYSLNARVRLATGQDAPVRASAMAAGRVGLWDVVAPPGYRSTLELWSRPDPFLILGSLGRTDMPASIPDRLLDTPAHPALRFSDLHAAGRVRFGPLRSLDASFYRGRQHLSGGVLSHTAQQQSLSEFTVIDDYEWTNRVGQARYEAVLGSRTLASIQARAGEYRLRNAYETYDSLNVMRVDGRLQMVGALRSPVMDHNRVGTAAVEGRFDHALERHQLQAGMETGVLDSRFGLHSVRFPDASDVDPSAEFVEPDRLATAQGSVRNDSGTWYAAAFGQDRFRIAEGVDVEAGLRATYLHSRRMVYAEPRIALYYRGAEGPFGSWSARTAAGLYRQFLNQADVSKLNAGALLPTVRIWLPTDASVAPPRSYHLAQEVIVQPSDTWTVRLDGYVKHEPHSPALAYAQAFSQGASSRFVTGRIVQEDVFVGARVRAYGGSVALTWAPGGARTEVRYAFAHSRRQSDELFGGRTHSTPWTQPHRLEIGLDWRPADRVTLSARWKGIWGRTWGFRQAYYDYFGHGASTRHHPPFDLGDPDAHVRPAHYQLDLSAAYSHSVSSVDVQIRAEVVNVLDRDNVLDWRLVPNGETWRKEARLLYPRMPSLAVRIRGL